MTLREEIRKMEEELTLDLCGVRQEIAFEAIESSMHAAIKLVLEREPSMEMKLAGSTVAIGTSGARSVYRQMTAQLLKELDAP